MNRFCQRQIVGLPFPVRHRISIVPTPSALSSTIRARHMLLRVVPRRDNGLEPLTISRAKPDFHTRTHPPRLAYSLARRNHSLVPIH